MNLTEVDIGQDVIDAMLCPICEYNTLLGTQHAWLTWVTVRGDDRNGPVKDINVVCRNACHAQYLKVVERNDWMIYDWYLTAFVGPTIPHPMLGFTGLVPRMGGLLCDYEWPHEQLKKFVLIMGGLSLMERSKDGEVVLSKGWRV